MRQSVTLDEILSSHLIKMREGTGFLLRLKRDQEKALLAVQLTNCGRHFEGYMPL